MIHPNTSQQGTSSFKYDFEVFIVKQACVIFKNVPTIWKSGIIIIIWKIIKRVCRWGREKVRWSEVGQVGSDLFQMLPDFWG